MTDTDLTILEIEAQRWKYPGAKEAAIRDQLGISATRYYQRLHALIERPDVEAEVPQLVRRLRRVRDARRGVRIYRPAQG